MRQFLIIASNIIIAAVMAIFIISYADRQHIESGKVAEQAFLNTAEVVSGVADNYLLDTQLICNGWANYINANEMTMESAIEYLSDTKAIGSVSAHVIWMDSFKGLSITEKVSDPGNYSVDYSGSLRNIFADMEAENGIGITARYNDPMTGEYVLSFCRKVRLLDENGELKYAVLLCVVPISYLEQKWIFPSEYTQASVALIKKTGEYILKPNSMKNDSFFSYIYYYNRGVIDQDELAENIANHDNGYFYGNNANGEECIWAFRSLKKEDTWSIVVAIPRSEIKGHATDWFIAGVIILGLALILIIDVTYFLVLIHGNKLVQAQLKEQAIELENTLRSERQNKSIVQGISHEYNSLWVVKIPEMEMILVQENTGNRDTVFREAVENNHIYCRIMNHYAETYVFEDDREYFREACAYENVKQQLKSQNVFSVTYKRVVGEKTEYYQLSFASTDSDDAFVMGFRNINEAMVEKQTQADNLAKALAEAEYANKAKTAFLSNMSHDIRTPMNAIIGFAALAQSNTDNQELVTNYLSKISLSGKYLLSLINDVLDMSRIESGKVKLVEKDVHLPDLFRELTSIIQTNVAAKNLNLFVDTVDVFHEDIVADKLRLNQIFLNIVGNAIKFTKPLGSIAIRLTEKACDEPGYAIYDLSVKDTGIGMTEEFRQHIFESFTREETATVTGIQGSGLGMAITKNIVDLMGGTISVSSEVNVGTEFVVSLKLKIAGKCKTYGAIPRFVDVRAMVVDNDYHTCASVSGIMKYFGMRCEWITTGKEAIMRAEHALESDSGFDIFVINYQLADMEGIELVQEIRRIVGDRDVRIIMTAYDRPDIKADADDMKGIWLCRKPVFISSMYNAITAHSSDSADAEEEKTYDFTGKHVLLVEDNELNQEIAAEILRSIGFAVDVASDGTDAIDIMGSGDAYKYDLILMDIQMPKMNGYECTRLIRNMDDERVSGIPIIAMTANAFEEDRRRAIESGMNGHISKPIDIHKMIKTLGEMLF